jgi:hypothetical protein
MVAGSETPSGFSQTSRQCQETTMNKTTVFALATSLLLAFGSAAMAGEGSPDLAQPYYGSHESDPEGSNYPSPGAFQIPYAGSPERYSTSRRLRERDLNTGRSVRQRNYEDESGIND